MNKVPRNAVLLTALSCFLGLGIVHCSSSSSSTPTTTTTVLDGGSDAAVTQTEASTDGGTEAGPKPGSGPVTGPVDRAGRPLAILLAINAADRDNWNADDSFSPTKHVYENEIQNNLIAADKWDTTANWDAAAAPDDAAATPLSDGGGTFLTHPLGDMMLHDRLIVDATKPFSPTGYLEIENEVYLSGPAHLSCGGRWPGEDAIDKELSLVVKGALTGVSDGVSAATAPPTQVFPYLAPPN